jgi:hypothetical protein
MPEIRPVQTPDESEIPDLLHLAKIYEGGLGKLWKDKSEAARILAITYPRIRREHLKWATSLLDFPSDVLDLFGAVGIGIWASRSLSDARRAQGLPVLQEKAAVIKAAHKNFSRAQLVDILTSEVGPQFDDPPMPKQFDPKKMSQTYHRGRKKGQWTSFHSAEEVLGISKGVIAAGCGFSDLPLPVRKLFEGKICSYDICRQVLEIEKAFGRKTLVERAGLISARATDVLEAEDVVRLLAGLVHDSATVIPRIRIPRHQRKLVVELYCEDSRFLLDRSSELMKIVETGLASLIEAALATLGASPASTKK